MLLLLAQEASAEGLLEAPALGAAAEPVAIAAGSRLGPYEVVGYVGAGGMGEVYRARDTRLGRLVAIKVLPPELAADASFRARFGREAKAISALNHPHVCSAARAGAPPPVPSYSRSFGQSAARVIRPVRLDPCKGRRLVRWQAPSTRWWPT